MAPGGPSKTSFRGVFRATPRPPVYYTLSLRLAALTLLIVARYFLRVSHSQGPYFLSRTRTRSNLLTHCFQKYGMLSGFTSKVKRKTKGYKKTGPVDEKGISFATFIRFYLEQIHSSERRLPSVGRDGGRWTSVLSSLFLRRHTMSLFRSPPLCFFSLSAPSLHCNPAYMSISRASFLSFSLSFMA